MLLLNSIFMQHPMGKICVIVMMVLGLPAVYPHCIIGSLVHELQVCNAGS